ncbi:MAG TPA: glycosyltransferase family 1 protein, partial [Blastococcus sp.]|nr:glycosyltransferase family 1 protein [Blastococcus sp.]
AEWADAVQALVGDWPRVRKAATRDATEARERHAVHRFAARLTEAVGAARPAGAPSLPGGRR